MKKENINSLNKTRRNRLATFREDVVNKNNHVRLLRRVLRHPDSFFNPTKLTARSTPTKSNARFNSNTKNKSKLNTIIEVNERTPPKFLTSTFFG